MPVTDLRPVKIAELESMFVREDARGQGIGKRLV
jgi:GNAT superfamily N-acetyltransferase